jgi:hypothetical protein
MRPDNSTLVNRLRGQYQVGPDGAYGTRSFADFIPPISLEAASRIEKLEETLQLVKNAGSVSQTYTELINLIDHLCKEVL